MTVNMTTEQALAACNRGMRRFEARCFNEMWSTYKLFDTDTCTWMDDTESSNLIEVEQDALDRNMNPNRK